MQIFTFVGCSLGGLGYFLPLLCCCLHPPHRVYIADQHSSTPRIAAVLALASPGCPLSHRRPHLQPTRGPNEAISCSFMQNYGSGPSRTTNRQRADRSTTALVPHTMIVDAAPVGPSGGLSYRFCGFTAKLQATVLVNRLSWVPWFRKPRSSQLGRDGRALRVTSTPPQPPP
jgi:hypothetical protein